MKIEYKSIVGPQAVKDIDTKGRVITVYYAAKNMVDSDKDSISDNAFTKSVQDWGPNGKNRIWHLINHNPERHVAKPFELMEDNYGLLSRVKLPNTSLGNDTLELYKEGHYSEHSIGFNTIKSENKGSYNEIQEVRLFEGSSVLWGANENTPTVNVKSLDKSFLEDEFERTIKSLRNGRFSDDTFELLELKLLQLKSIVLSHLQPPVAPVLKKSIEDDAEILRAIKAIKIRA
jgi:HK97 family phage prohead protease